MYKRQHYYLVGNHENYDDMSTLRVDRIAHVTVLNERRKPLREIKGYQQQRTFNVSQYVKEHIYMLSLIHISSASISRRISFSFAKGLDFGMITDSGSLVR